MADRGRVLFYYTSVRKDYRPKGLKNIMFTRVSSAIVALALIILVVGCSKAPEAQLKASEDAIQGAQLAEAEQYAPSAYRQALDSLNTAKAEIQKQDSKFSLFRKYGQSEQMLVSAQKLAEQAQTQAVAEKEQARLRDSVLVANVEGLLATAKTELASAPKGKGTRADIELMKTDLTAAETAYAVAVSDYQAGKYLAAEAKFKAVESQVNRIRQEIEAAKQKVSGKSSGK